MANSVKVEFEEKHTKELNNQGDDLPFRDLPIFFVKGANSVYNCNSN